VADQLLLKKIARGAVVTNVEPFTPAATAGVRPGDVITQINRQPITTAPDALRMLHAIKAGGSAFLLLNREGTQLFVVAQRE
jgi:serine protease Do